MRGVQFIVLFVVIIVEAQYRRLPLTTKSWEASEENSDISSHAQATDNLTQTTSKPDVIIIYPEPDQNKSFFNSMITSFNDNIPRLSTFKHEQDEKLNKALKERSKTETERTQSNSDKIQPELEPDSNSDKKLNLKLESENGQQSNLGIKRNTEPTPDNKSELEIELEPEVEPATEPTNKTEPQPELQNKPKLNADPELKTGTKFLSELQREPKTNEQLRPIQMAEPISKPAYNKTELKSKDKPKTRPRPPYPGYFKTIISPVPKLDRGHLNTKTPAPSTFKPTTETPEPVTSTEITITTPTATMTTLIPEMEIQCTEENGYHAIPYECDTFVECKEYVGEKLICPDGLMFNLKARWPEFPCAYPAEVECGNKTIIQEPEPSGECPRRFGTFPSQSGDCGKYVVCDDGRALHMSCPNGLAFNSITSGCDWPENVPDCKPKVFEDFTCPEPPKDLYDRLSEKVYNYKYQDSCKEYIACSKGEPRLLRCDSRLSFDDISKHCIDSKLVTNCERYSNE